MSQKINKLSMSAPCNTNNIDFNNIFTQNIHSWKLFAVAFCVENLSYEYLFL